MNVFGKGALGAAAVALMAATGAEAQLTPHNDPMCSLSDMTYMAFTATDCRGNFTGNNTGARAPDVIDYINSVWGLGLETGSGSTTEAGDLSGAGPFESFDEELTSGTLTFDGPVSGDFVVALKASDFFSLYLFRGAEDWEYLEFTTSGVTTDPVRALSHATLYGGTVRVPEPSSALLLVGGMILFAWFARRRREDLLV